MSKAPTLGNLVFQAPARPFTASEILDMEGHEVADFLEVGDSQAQTYLYDTLEAIDDNLYRIKWNEAEGPKDWGQFTLFTSLASALKAIQVTKF